MNKNGLCEIGTPCLPGHRGYEKCTKQNLFCFIRTENWGDEKFQCLPSLQQGRYPDNREYKPKFEMPNNITYKLSMSARLSWFNGPFFILFLNQMNNLISTKIERKFPGFLFKDFVEYEEKVFWSLEEVEFYKPQLEDKLRTMFVDGLKGLQLIKKNCSLIYPELTYDKQSFKMNRLVETLFDVDYLIYCEKPLNKTKDEILDLFMNHLKKDYYENYYFLIETGFVVPRSIKLQVLGDDDDKNQDDEIPDEHKNPPSDKTPSKDKNPPKDEKPSKDKNPPKDEKPSKDKNPPSDKTPSKDKNPPKDEKPSKDKNPPIDKRYSECIRENQQTDFSSDGLTNCTCIDGYEFDPVFGICFQNKCKTICGDMDCSIIKQHIDHFEYHCYCKSPGFHRTDPYYPAGCVATHSSYLKLTETKKTNSPLPLNPFLLEELGCDQTYELESGNYRCSCYRGWRMNPKTRKCEVTKELMAHEQTVNCNDNQVFVIANHWGSGACECKTGNY